MLWVLPWVDAGLPLPAMATDSLGRVLVGQVFNLSRINDRLKTCRTGRLPREGKRRAALNFTFSAAIAAKFTSPLRGGL